MATYQSIRTGSRRTRMIAIGLLIATAVKVYFVDLSEILGLARVIILFIFGFVLLGFNFIDRKAQLQINNED